MEETSLKNNELSLLHKGSDNQVETVFDLLKKGESEIVLSDRYKDIVLVLGNTGSGKSTFTQWIAGDNDNLIAKEVSEGTGEYIIEDTGDRIGNSTIQSKTVFPELVVDSQTNTAFYDCPGFSDTRSTKNDIATTYFIKRVLDHADSVKMIFVLNHSSVRKGVDRQDFMTLLKHITELIKDVEKFRNSVAIVTTKVDNQYIKQGKQFILVPDNKVIDAIADFLVEVKQDLEQKIQLKSFSDKDKNFYENAVKFINGLLIKRDKIYTKIGIFRRPDEAGPLSKISVLQEGKNHIEIMINNETNFTVKNKDDFGYTISEKSKIDITDLIEEINKTIWSEIRSITENVQKQYQDLLDQIFDKIKAFVTSSIGDVEQSEAETAIQKLDNGYNVTSSLVEDLKHLTNQEELSNKINDTLSNMGLNVPKDNIYNISYQGKYFDFLELVSEKKFTAKSWEYLFENLIQFLSESKKNAKNQVEEISLNINRLLNSAMKEIRGFYYAIMKTQEIQKLPSELSKAHDIALNISEKIESAKSKNDVHETMQIIREWAGNLGLSINSSTIAVIVNQKIYSNYLQTLGFRDLNHPLLTWISPFQDTVKYLDQSRKWYRFLNSLYLKFSEYGIQKDRNKYNKANLEDWGEADKPQGIKVTKNNLDLFLNKTAEYNLEEYDNVKNFVITDQQIEELNKLLNLTLKQSTQISCKKPFIFIKGHFIKSSDIPEIINNANRNDNCKDFLTNDNFKFINIFSLNTIFIDQDLLFSGLGLPVTVISPKWEIIGTRKIDLNGQTGKTHYKIYSENSLRGNTKAKDGENGNPGLPGGPGGAFLGIGERFTNGRGLTITARGGKGGSGQNGRNGQNGADGNNPQVPKRENVPCRSDLCDDYKQINGFDCEKNYYNDKPIYWSIDDYFLECIYTMKGTRGKNGGNGGNGGKGGKGGKPGNISFIDLNDNTSGVSTNEGFGEEGRDGAGGKGGIGGKNGDTIVIQYKSFNEITWFRSSWSEWELKERIGKNRATSGKDGIRGANSKDEEPKEGKIITELFTIINEYKSYTRENLNDRFNDYDLKHFLDRLETNRKVKSTYNTLGFIDELQGLEQQFKDLNANINLVPYYQSILNRIDEYSRNSDEVKNSSEHKKVLSYLYTTILSKIFRLENNIEANLILKIQDYLNLVTADIDTLKDVQNSKNKVDIINKYKENYKKRIDMKVKEAKSVTKEILDEIDNVNAEVNNSIEKLVNEVIDLQKQVKVEQKLLVEKKDKLKQAIALQGLFSALKLSGQIIKFLGPYGAIAGTVLEGGSSMVESLVLDKHNDQHETFKLPESVLTDIKMQESQLQNIKTEKIALLNEILEDMSEEFNKHSEKIDEISIILSSIKNKLNELDKNKFDLVEIHILENALLDVLQANEKKLTEAQKTAKDKKLDKALKALNKYVKATFQISSGLVNIYNQYKNNKAQLETINEAIDHTEFQFQALKRYEENIYNNMIPMIQNIKNEIDNVERNLDTQSKVALDMTKWKVQSILKDTKLKMQQITQGFQVKDNLAHCIEKLADSMSILIKVYDHVQDYQEQQNFANYIADISSVSAININVIDNNLRNAVNSLDIKIRSNIILQKYQTATEALKQFVFPFAHDYFKELLLPSQLEFGDTKMITDLNNLVDQVSQQMKKLSSNINYYQVSTNENDGYIGSGEFRSYYKSSSPFFIWKNERHKNTISKLLSGKEVIVYADIKESMPMEEAIKFNVIDHYFRARNETLQTEVNNVLESFRMYATHLGDSYYRYNNKIYLITTNSQLIWYNLEKIPCTEEPVQKGGKYDRIQKGDFMLSPYAMWKFKLTNVNKDFTFEDLSKFSDKVDLELGGVGRFINKEEMGETDLMVDNYYSAVDSCDEQSLKRFTKKSNQTLFPCERKKHKRNISAKYIKNEDSLKESGYFRLDKDIYVSKEYLTNAAVSHHLSPINNVCNWLKESSILFPFNILVALKTLPSIFGITISGNNLGESLYNSLTAAFAGKLSWYGEFFHDTQEYITEATVRKTPFEDPEFDQYYDANENFPESIIEENRKSAETTHNPKAIFNKVKSRDVSINYRDFPEYIMGFNNINVCPPLLSSQDKIEFTHRVQSFERSGSLILADVIARSVTREKYKQLSYLSPWQEKMLQLFHAEQKVVNGLKKMEAIYGWTEIFDVLSEDTD